jgi:MFS family permease
VSALARGISPILYLVFLFLMGRTMASPVVPAYYLALGFSATEISVILMTFGAVFLVSEAFWGFAIRVLGSRAAIAALVITSGSTSVFYARPESFAVIVLLQAASAFGFGGIGVFPRVMVSRVGDMTARGRAFGFLGLVFSLGVMAGSLLGGATNSIVGLSGTFILATAVSMTALLPLPFITIPPQPGRSAGAGPQAVAVHGTRIRRTELAVLALIAPTTAMCSAFFNLLLPNILVQTPSLSASVFDISIMIALFSVAAGPFQPLFGSLGSKNPRLWIISGLLGCGIIVLLLTQASSFLEIDTITFLAGIANSAITPLSLLLLSSGISAGLMGRALGLYGAAEDFGLILGGSVGGFVWAFWGYYWVYIAVSSMFLTMALVYAVTLGGGGRERNPAYSAAGGAT